MKINFVDAYVLTGGKSARLGQNKALLPFNNQTFIDYIVARLKKIFENVVIVTKKEQEALYKGKKIVFDLYDHQSPLVGIFTALIHTRCDYIFVKSCDNPVFSIDLIKRMIELINGYDIVAPRLSDGLHPLFAIYSKNCISTIKRQIEKGNFKVIDFFNSHKVYFLDEEESLLYDPKLSSFININTIEDYNIFKRDYL